MFTQNELYSVIHNPNFQLDFSAVKQSLVNNRLKQLVLLPVGSEERLTHFVEAVLAAAPDWLVDAREELCRIAGEIAEAVAAGFSDNKMGKAARRKAALLYELANMPALAAAVLSEGDFPHPLISFFTRSGQFKCLNGRQTSTIVEPRNNILLGEYALLDDAIHYGEAAQQETTTELRNISTHSVTSSAWKIAAAFDLGLSASELRAFSVVITERSRRAAVGSVRPAIIPLLRKMQFPLELLPAQSAAIDSGLLNQDFRAWGFAAPTGSGKTFLSRLLIIDLLSSFPEHKVIYLVPSKALVSEVAHDLSNSLNPLGFTTVAVSAQLVDLDNEERGDLDSASVVVMTPEKADMLLRLGADFLSEVYLVVVDEAHHVESGTRGALLELYLWRLKRMLSSTCRYVFLSAVAPNIKDIVQWLDPGGNAIAYPHRPNRMRVGIYRLRGQGVRARGEISYADGTSVVVVSERAETTIRQGICQLAEFLHTAGPLLIVAKGKKECENIAIALSKWIAASEKVPQLSAEELATDTYRSLDASLEREMYPDVALRKLVRNRVAYHHAGLPPSVRYCVEEAVRKRLIDYVIATTTLAEGVNFPFSSVIVQSLALKEPPEAGRPSRYSPITPRTFWNIAGRAGRPGFDAEGQVVLFEPSLGLDRINAVIEPYLRPDLATMAPVESALAKALKEIEIDLSTGAYQESALSSIALPLGMSRRAKGALNLLRVGVVHARAAGLIRSPEEILDGSFALQFLSEHEAVVARRVLRYQNEAMETYVAGGDAPTFKKLAELGLSLETLTDLRKYVHDLQDWQLHSCGNLFFGGNLRIEQAQYVIGPVAKRMSELEGPALGGFLSDVIIRWLSGVTFTSIRAQSNFEARLEDLIAVVYSRIQYLLPWGLWATDWLIEQEALRRNINYDNQVKNLAYLADAGVPNFDALNLVHTGFERVDATRLSQAYSSSGGLRTGMDFIGWLLTQSEQALESILRGQDSRRIEHGFFGHLDSLRGRTR